jgi:aminopeptidase-like protein
VQIQNYHGEINPYNHTTRDSLAYINPDYLLEQMKATVIFAAHLAVLSAHQNVVYLPLIFRPANH